MNTELKFELAKQAGTRQRRSFLVPAACGCLHLEHDLPQKYALLVFLTLINPEGEIRFLKLLGWSGQELSLGADGWDTTIGGVPGAIDPGIWTAEVFLLTENLPEGFCIPFHLIVSDRRAEVMEKIGGCVWTAGRLVCSNYDFQRIWRKEAGWYKGDLHTHTQLSDGKELPEGAMKKAEDMQLDYYVPTEHNAIHTGWPESSVMVVPGIEVTTGVGHANLFGIDRLPSVIEAVLFGKNPESQELVMALVAMECKERGWLFSVNHPFLHIWKWLYDGLRLEDMDCLEIINDPTYEADEKAGAGEANQKAVLLSDLLWADGYRICAVGGSDSHMLSGERYPGAAEPSVAGDPATWLYMEQLSPMCLLDALRGCRSYVTRHCSVKTDVRFGSCLEDRTEWFSYSVCLEGLSEAPELFYLHNGIRYSCTCVRDSSGGYRADGKIILGEGYQWIRFGAETQGGDFLFYGNPVTRGRKEHRFHTFGEIREWLEEQWRSRESCLTKMEH